jgi:hypothetical protein
MSIQLSHIEDLVHRSQFVFSGLVQKIKATTVPGIQVNDRTAVVKIEEVLHAPGVLAGYSGHEITVQLRQPARAGERAIFFTTPRVYAKSVVVDEVERVQTDKDASALRENTTQVKQAVAKLPDRHVQRRSSDADLVVVGKVSSVTPVRSRQPYPITRHDPEWHEARIEVERVERGRLPAEQLVVLFPQSTDVMWKASPKFQTGQEGIWILHKQEVKALRRSYYLALDSGDFHPRDQQSRIHELLKAV